MGAVRAGEVVLLEGAPDLLNACAHAFLVEAVRELPEGDGGPLARDPRAVVVDGGNCVSPYLFAEAAREAAQDAALLTPRVRLARAFTAHQLVALLGDALELELSGGPCDLLVVLAVRELFEDPDLGDSEARALARLACEGLKGLAAAHGLPCVATSPSPWLERQAIALERIAAESASRVVADLRFESVPGLGGTRGRGAALEPASLRASAAQRPLDVWGEMPPRARVVGKAAARAAGAILIQAHWRPRKAGAGAPPAHAYANTGRNPEANLKVEAEGVPMTGRQGRDGFRRGG